MDDAGVSRAFAGTGAVDDDCVSNEGLSGAWDHTGVTSDSRRVIGQQGIQLKRVPWIHGDSLHSASLNSGLPVEEFDRETIGFRSEAHNGQVGVSVRLLPGGVMELAQLQPAMANPPLATTLSQLEFPGSPPINFLWAIAVRSHWPVLMY